MTTAHNSAPETPRIGVVNHGSIISLMPLNKEAQEWIDEHLEVEPWQYMGPTICCDARSAMDVVQGAQDEVNFVPGG